MNFLYLIVFPLVYSRPWHYMRNNQNTNITDPSIIRALCNVGKSKYFIIKRLMDWVESRDACAKYCSSLATFTDHAQAQEIASTLNKLDISTPALPPDYFIQRDKYEFARDRRYWIGLNDLGREGVWTWTQTNMTLNYTTMWYTNQPDHFRNKGEKTNTGSEHCVTLWNPIFYRLEIHTFNDEPCTMQYYALCNPADQNRTTLEGNEYEPASKCLRPAYVGC